MKKLLQKETFRSIGYVTVGKAGSVLLGLATVSLSARGLGVQNFGLLALFYSLVELTNLLTLPGFNSILQKALHHKNYQFAKNAYKFTFLASVTLGPAIYLLLKLLNQSFEIVDQQTMDVFLHSLAFVAFRSLDKSEAIFPALKKFQQLAVFTFLSSFIRFCALGLGTYYTKDLLLSLKIYICLQTLLGIFSFWYSFKTLKAFNSQESSINFTKESVQMSLLALFNTGIGQLDRLLLYNLSATTLGIYQAGISYPEKLREVMKTYIMTLTNTWLSFGNKEFLKRTLNNVVILAVVAIAGSTVMYFLPRIYIPLLLGEQFLSSVQIAGLFGVIIFIKSINYFFQTRDIVFESLLKHQFKIVIYRIGYIVLLFLLIKDYQIMGVIITIMASEALYLAMLIGAFIKNLKKEKIKI